MVNYSFKKIHSKQNFIDNFKLLNQVISYASFNPNFVIAYSSIQFRFQFQRVRNNRVYLYDIFPMDLNPDLIYAISEKETKINLKCKALDISNKIVKLNIDLSFINNRIQIAIKNDINR